jgi:hypothetical protein
MREIERVVKLAKPGKQLLAPTLGHGPLDCVETGWSGPSVGDKLALCTLHLRRDAPTGGAHVLFFVHLEAHHVSLFGLLLIVLLVIFLLRQGNSHGQGFQLGTLSRLLCDHAISL